MATTIGRVFTLLTAAPEILAAADEAGPELRELLDLAERAAKLMERPALEKLVTIAKRVIGDLDLGGTVLPGQIVTPKEAIKAIAAGNISREQKVQLDIAGQSGGL